MVAGVLAAAALLSATSLNARDGTIVFVSPGRQALVAVRANGASPRAVFARRGTFVWTPAWSSDHSRIAFSASRSPSLASAFVSAEVDVVATATGRAHAVTRNRVGDWRPVWSPDDRTLAFDRRSRAGEADVVLASPDGSRQRALAAGGEPAWSNEGRLAYVSTDGRVVVGDAPVADAAASFPSWSPNGSTLAFLTRGGLELAESDGTGLRSVALGARARADRAPAWSPDGAHVAVACGTASVCVVSPARGRVVRIRGGGAIAGVAWSPDGTALVISTGGALVVADANGAHRSTIGRGVDPIWG